MDNCWSIYFDGISNWIEKHWNTGLKNSKIVSKRRATYLEIVINVHLLKIDQENGTTNMYTNWNVFPHDKCLKQYSKVSSQISKWNRKENIMIHSTIIIITYIDSIMNVYQDPRIPIIIHYGKW